MRTTNGRKFMVSDEDAGLIRKRTWHAANVGEHEYVARSVRSKRTLKKIYAQREIARPCPGQRVVFVNGDTLDLRRKNLVVVGSDNQCPVSRQSMAAPGH